jgi:2-C-methyl-D-erythritol 4-phosphate cytidylyltransferase
MAGGAGPKKQFAPLAGAPVLAWSAWAVARAPQVRELVLVVGEGDVAYCGREIAAGYPFGKPVRVVAGGRDRQESVSLGARAACPDCAVVAVHDGARPLIGVGVIGAACEAALLGGAAVVAVPVTDTVKVARAGRVARTLDRSELWAAQTPQAFRRGLLLRALDAAERDGYRGTDDSSLAERLGEPVAVVEGSYDNIKITTPGDFAAAEGVIARLGLRPPPAAGAPHA